MQVEKPCQGLESRLGPELKGLSLLSPPEATFALYYKWGFRAQGTKEGNGRKHLSVPSLGSQGSDTGQDNSTPVQWGWNVWQGWAYPWPVIPWQYCLPRTLAKGVCNEHWVSTDLGSGLSLLEKSYITMGQPCPAPHPLMRPLDMTSQVMGGTLQNKGAPGPALGS